MSDQESVDQVEGLEATLRTNKFTLQMSGLSNLKFEESGYSITSGQPWQGISNIGYNDSGCTMYVMAGRKRSTAPANWFTRNVEPGSYIGRATLPKELNFAFKGNMSFDNHGQTFTGEDIVITQGHDKWWIGGPTMELLPSDSSAAQTFKTNVSPYKAKVTFKAVASSTVQLGVITLYE